MAQHTTVTMVDDITGEAGDDVKALDFAFDGKVYEIDLSDASRSAFAELLAHVGDADAFEWGAEDGTFYTYFEYQQERIDSKRLREELPGVASQYLSTTPYRAAYRRRPKKSPRGKRG